MFPGFQRCLLSLFLSSYKLLFNDQTCKPGSVVCDNLSRLRVTSAAHAAITPLPTGSMFRQRVPIGVASDKVYIAAQSPALWCALTAPFHPYHEGSTAQKPPDGFVRYCLKSRRYLSVALALGSPPAAVNSYPTLRCPDFPHSNAALSHSLLEKSSFARKRSERTAFRSSFVSFHVRAFIVLL